MTNVINHKKAYSEVDAFIDLLSDETKSKLPKELIDFFKKEKDFTYKKEIDSNKPIKEQNFSEEALSIIAYLNLEYLCEDENEKQQLIKIYNENERKHQQTSKLNGIISSDIFGSKKNQFFNAMTRYFRNFYHI